jgi:hypothetical protein
MGQFRTTLDSSFEETSSSVHCLREPVVTRDATQVDNTQNFLTFPEVKFRL